MRVECFSRLAPIILVSTVLLFGGSDFGAVKAHNHADCGTPDRDSQTMNRIMDIAKKKKKRPQARIAPSSTTITIDTYFCVVTDTAGNGDVADSVLLQQLSVINTNFANSNSSFQFQLKGIRRYRQSNALNTFLQNYVNSVGPTCRQGGMDVLNIYVVPNILTTSSGTTVGQSYSFFDTGSSYTDGVYVVKDALPGGSNYYDHLGIVAVHEIGHWLGLIHVFQSSGNYVSNPCNPKNPQDYIADTPQMSGPSNDWCPTGKDTCPNLPGLDPIHNFMDYTFDSDRQGRQCRTQFTPLQVLRMQDIWYYYRVQNEICAITELQFNLQLKFDASPQTISWDIKFPNATLVHSSFDEFGIPYNTAFAWQTINLNRCLARGFYIFGIYDSSGNGIASPGYYQLSVNGQVVATGGQDFKSAKTISFGLTAATTFAPSLKPTNRPTSTPTRKPTNGPTWSPTPRPSLRPSSLPPTPAPTLTPTLKPSLRPTTFPTSTPSSTPSSTPTRMPTSPPSLSPTTPVPTLAPSQAPVASPPPVSPAPSPVSDVTTAPITVAPTPSVAPAAQAPTTTLSPTPISSHLETDTPTQPLPSPKSNSSTIVIPVPPGFCFSAANTVEVQDRGIVSIKELRIGDMVRDATGKMARVYSFGHYHLTVKSEYLQIHSKSLPQPLEISNDHLVFVNNGTAIPASAVSVGDKLHLGGETRQVAEVSKINFVIRAGAFAPFTTSGTILVSGVAASSYVTLQEGSPVLALGAYKTPLSMHWLSHISQSPHRLVCAWAKEFCEQETYTVEGISKWVEGPLYLSQWLVRQNGFVMIMILVPFVLLGLIICFLEVVSNHYFGSLLAIGAMLASVRLKNVPNKQH